MHDAGLMTATELAPADRAVKYLLDRIQQDANLRWYMLDTQALALMCEAEAFRLGKEIETISESRSKDLTPERHRREPDAVKLRKLVDACSHDSDILPMRVREAYEAHDD